MTLIKRWKKVPDDKEFGRAVLIDSSIAFDALNYELLIAKLGVYGFNNESLKLIQPKLTNMWQRTKTNERFSKWIKLLQCVPQVSVLGFLLFNIYIYNIYLNDLFFLSNYTEICNFADDTIFFARGKDLGSLVNRLAHDSFL